jgi:hypothetical protein
LPRSVSRTGSWKQKPKAKMNFSARSVDSRIEPRNTVRNSVVLSETAGGSAPRI